MLAHDNLLIDQSLKLMQRIQSLETEKSQFDRLADTDSSTRSEGKISKKWHSRNICNTCILVFTLYNLGIHHMTKYSRL